MINLELNKQTFLHDMPQIYHNMPTLTKHLKNQICEIHSYKPECVLQKRPRYLLTFPKY